MYNNPEHHLRFEVADNWFHENKYANAGAGFSEFIKYCDSQQSLTEEERGWVKYYRQLALSRIKEIKNRTR